MADSIDKDHVTEGLTELEKIQTELAERKRSEFIKDSMIVEYLQALSDAHYRIAALNGQLKLANQPTA